MNQPNTKTIASKSDTILFELQDVQVIGQVDKVLNNSVIVSYNTGKHVEQTVVNHKRYSILNK